jgi:cell division protein FtsZ
VHKLEEETVNEQEETIEQVSFEFEVSSSITEIKESSKEVDYSINAKQEEPTLIVKKVEEKFESTIPSDDRMRLANERVNRLKSLSHKFKTPQGLSEMESQPAYLRKNVTLSNVPHSSDSQVSRFTLSEGDDKSAEIKPNNSFLHDNVD